MVFGRKFLVDSFSPNGKGFATEFWTDGRTLAPVGYEKLSIKGPYDILSPPFIHPSRDSGPLFSFDSYPRVIFLKSVLVAQTLVLMKTLVSNVMPILHSFVALWQQEESHLIEKVHLFLKFTAINKDIFCLTYKNLIGCFVCIFFPYTSMHARYKLLSRLTFFPLLWATHWSWCGHAFSALNCK